MGTGGKSRWKISSFYHRSVSSPTPSIPAKTQPPPPLLPTKQQPPKEFLCPISGRLMADPVILSSGQTFDRNCIQACKDLGFCPSLPPPPPPENLALIPNHALKSAILRWCHSQTLNYPQPISPTTALNLARALQPSPQKEKKEREENGGNKDEFFDTNPTPPSLPPAKPSSSSYYSPSNSSPSSSSPSYSTSFSSSEIVAVDGEPLTPNTTKKGSPFTSTSPFPLEEDIILAKLKSPNVSDQEEALVRLRTATRDGGRDSRTSLCSPRLLAGLRPFLLSRYPSLQINAAASLVNLSLEPPNRVPIVRSGAVPPLVDALKAGHPEARGHAAAALFSLATEDSNKAAIGVLGALPPLLHLLSTTSADEKARQDAGMALCHLSTAGTNRSKLVRLGAARALLGIAAAARGGDVSSSPSLADVAVMILCNVAACGEGRTALMDAGAVERLMGLIRECGNSEADGLRREHCLAALYGMSRGSMRFRGLARAAGVEDVLSHVAAEEGSEEEKGGGGWKTREMARRTLRAVRGEEETRLRGGDEDETRSCVSDPAVSFRKRHGRLMEESVLGTNSSEF